MKPIINQSLFFPFRACTSWTQINTVQIKCTHFVWEHPQQVFVFLFFLPARIYLEASTDGWDELLIKKKRKSGWKKIKVLREAANTNKESNCHVNVHLGSIYHSRRPRWMKVNAEEKQERKKINEIKTGMEIKAKPPSDYPGLLHSCIFASTNDGNREVGT